MRLATMVPLTCSLSLLALALAACGDDDGAPAADAPAAGPDAPASPGTDAPAPIADAETLDAGPADAVTIDPRDAGPASTRQTPRPLGSTEAAQGYHEYLPPGYGDGRRYPLLVFLHGVGERPMTCRRGTTSTPGC